MLSALVATFSETLLRCLLSLRGFESLAAFRSSRLPYDGPQQSRS